MEKIDLNIGKIFDSNTCGKLKVLELAEIKKFPCNNVYKVEFLETGSIRNACISNIKRGEVLDYTIERKRVNKYGGYGKLYNITDNFYDGPIENIAARWRNLLRRVSTEVSYKYVTICDEWYNFDNFYKFVKNPENGFKGDGYELDKDILCHNRKDKLYSPETCLFIPRILNVVLLDRQTHKTSKYPSGVTDNKNWKYDTIFANIQIGARKLSLCSSNREGRKGIIKCFSYYKYAKEFFLKLLTDELFKLDLITKRVKDSVYNYEIHDKRDVDDNITDDETYTYITCYMSDEVKSTIERKVSDAFELFKSRIKRRP